MTIHAYYAYSNTCMHVHNYSYALLSAIYNYTLKLLESLNCLPQFPIATCIAAPVTSGGSVT